jgi:hypothetical protein
LAAKYCLDHWRHIVEGGDIQVPTDHQSLNTYRTKKDMTKRLIRFMNDVEHYNPLFVYRPGHLQKVSDALSRMPGVKEEGEPADTPRFLAVEVQEKSSQKAKVEENKHVQDRNISEKEGEVEEQKEDEEESGKQK